MSHLGQMGKLRPRVRGSCYNPKMKPLALVSRGLPPLLPNPGGGRRGPERQRWGGGGSPSWPVAEPELKPRILNRWFLTCVGDSLVCGGRARPGTLLGSPQGQHHARAKDPFGAQRRTDGFRWNRRQERTTRLWGAGGWGGIVTASGDRASLRG